MFKYFITLIPICVILIVLGCNTESTNVKRSFYYWKTTYSLSKKKKEYLSDLNAKTIYLRFFDVEWYDNSNTALSVAPIRFNTQTETTFTYIPVVYITNNTLKNIPESAINALSANILKQVSHIASENSLKYSELQIDCDWTETTKEKYFHLLNLLKEQLHTENRLLSTTIRLHQIKYAAKTGIPQVDRGVLMFYNMGKLNAESSESTIFNAKDASKYVSHIKNYPLPLDVALPIFSWAVHIRNEKIIGLEKFAASSLDTVYFKSISDYEFIAKSSFYFKGKYIKEKDILRIDEISPDICEEAANLLVPELKPEKRSVILFDFDSLTISNYEKEDFENIFNRFD